MEAHAFHPGLLLMFQALDFRVEGKKNANTERAKLSLLLYREAVNT